MKFYKYSALSKSGEKVTGEIEAQDRKNVIDQLSEQGHLVVDVSETNQTSQSRNKNHNSIFSKKPSNARITLFTRELAMLLKAGVPLDKALTLLQNDLADSNLNHIISGIRKEIGDGKSFYEALDNAGPAFPAIYVNMIRVAEVSGTLSTVLDRIAKTREKEEKLKSKTLSAMIYPCFLILASIAAIIVMLVYVVPEFKEIIINASSEIPEDSRFVIGLSDWLIANGSNLIIALLGFSLIILILLRNDSFRQSLDLFLFKVPIIGNILKMNLTIRFCRTLGTLLENGVELPVAMSLTKNVLGNKAAENVLIASSEALRKGQNFLQPLIKSKLFPSVVINMLQVGEETGNLSSSSIYMADMFEEKLETSIQRIFTIMEPVIILLVSVFVAGIIISIIGAVLSLNDLAL